MRDVSRSSEIVVIVGGGTMGSGIAQVMLEAGAEVHVIERSDADCDAALGRIRHGLQLRLRERSDAASVVEDHVHRLRTATEPDDTVSPTLVVESVYESYDTKQAVLASLSERYPASVIASNTSALSLDRLAGSVVDPGRFLGMHFFNPVPRSALVELVVLETTRRDAVDCCREWSRRLGKDTIEVRNAPGFATSRLGIVLGLEAMRMVEEGVASAADIDKGMVLGYRFPIGPLELTDLVGLDIRLAIADHLADELGERFTPPGILRDLVAAGHLGRKTGRGFYTWDPDGSLRRSGA